MVGDPAGSTQAAQHSGAVPAADVCSSTAASDAANGSSTAAASQHSAAPEPRSGAAGQLASIVSYSKHNTPKYTLTLSVMVSPSQASLAAGRQTSNQNGTSSTQSGPSQTTVSFCLDAAT